MSGIRNSNWEYPMDTSEPIEYSSKLLAIGGDCLKKVKNIEIYDVHKKRWVKRGNIKIGRKNFSVQFVEDKVLIIGGTESPIENCSSLNTVQSLDLSTGLLWTEAPLNESRQYAATVAHNLLKMSFVCVFGGQNELGELSSVERWDTVSRRWTHLPPMPNKRSGLQAAVLENSVYILGGRIGSNYTNTMEAYCLKDRQWKAKAPMKEARAHFCVAVCEGYMYAVSGSKQIDTYINAVEKYDPSNDCWVTIANVTMNGHVGVASLGNRLICAGGLNSKSVFEYDSEANSWSKLEDMHEPRSGYLLPLPKTMKHLRFDWEDRAIQRKLLMIQNQESSTAKSLEVFDSQTNQWTRLKDLNIGSTNNGVAYDGDFLLMIGGASFGNNFLNKNIKIDLGSGRVELIAPLNVYRQQCAVVIVKQGMFKFAYAIGGKTDRISLNSIERWDSLSRFWTIVTPMKIARTGHGAVLVGDQIMVAGGETTETGAYYRTVEAYDFVHDRWTSRAPMNIPRAYFGIAAFKNYVYVVGGNEDPRTPVNTVERYDPVQNIWITIANISSEGPVSISSMGDRLICAGGKSSNIVEEYDQNCDIWRPLNPLNNVGSGLLVELQPGTKVYSGDWYGFENLLYIGDRSSLANSSPVEGNVEKFDVMKQTWTQLQRLPFTKVSYDVNLISNKLVFIGGHYFQDAHKINRKYGTFLNEVDAIDLSSGTIDRLPSLKEERFAPSSVVVTQEDGKQTLYVFGGYDSKTFLSSVEKWDPSADKWTQGIPMPTGRYGHGSVLINGKIYVVGGFHNERLNIVEAFSLKDNKWETKAPMNRGRFFFGITVLEGKIYVAGGKNNQTVERYDPDSDTWTILASIESSGKVGLCGFGQRLICAGGEQNTAQEYDFARNRWVSLPSKILEAGQHGYLLRFPENAVFGDWGDSAKRRRLI